jgi:sporulation protein YlmC with PRC-barrel domain
VTTNASSAGAGQPILPVLSRNWWALALRGVVAIVFGVLLGVMPGPGILALVWLIGAYAIVSGVLLIILAFRVRNESGSEGSESDQTTADNRRFTKGSDLVKASYSDPALEDRAQDRTQEVDQTEDFRGREVHNRGGQEVGTVEDMYVDREGATTRFLVVGAAPGLDGGRFLIPIETVSGISSDQVTLDQDRDKVADSPSFEREVEPDRRYQVAIYRYYGYM